MPLAIDPALRFVPQVTAAPNRPLVSLDGIVKRFGAFAANDGASLLMREGELHALLGENGAGKSTLVKILFGLLQPDSGEIRWRGEPVRIDGPVAARRLGIAMVFQHFSCFENLTVVENVALGLPGRRADRRLAEETGALASRYGLSINLEAPVWSLSAGERQRIEILRALLQAPKLLILDEPTSVLTPQESEALFVTLERLATDGASVLFISHKLDEVRRLCSAATILRAGRTVATADPRTQTSRALAALMVGAEVPELRRSARPEAQAQPAVLEIADLAVTPDNMHAVPLAGLSLDVRAGEIVAIAGVAGSGQKELFAALSGEEGRVTAGALRIAGRDAAKLNVLERRALGAAFVPEDRLGQATLPAALLSENLVLSLPRGTSAGALGLLRRSSLRQTLAEVTARFDVRASAADPEARRLSGGNLQKYVLGREILRRPKLLVVNQPTWGVDAASTLRIREALIGMAEEGAAILVISQDLDEVFAIADRVAAMRAGRLSMARPIAEVTREDVGLLMTEGEGMRDAA